MGARLGGEVLVAAKAYLEPQGRDWCVEGFARLARINAQARQQRANQLVLSDPQPLAFATPIKCPRPLGAGRAPLLRQDSADRKVSARSVRSQEKPPSASG